MCLPVPLCPLRVLCAAFLVPLALFVTSQRLHLQACLPVPLCPLCVHCVQSSLLGDFTQCLVSVVNATVIDMFIYYEVTCSVGDIQGVSNSSLPKTFWNIFTSLFSLRLSLFA